MLSTANKTCSGYPDKRSEKKRKSSEDKSKPLYVAYLLSNPFFLAHLVQEFLQNNTAAVSLAGILTTRKHTARAKSAHSDRQHAAPA